ncbi:MAG: GTPase, partial [archaeon]
MPANLTPQYYEAEKAFKNAKTKEEKIAALEEMLAVIPKHKGTDKLQADLRKKLSQIRKSDDNKGGNIQDDPYLIEKQGAGQVVLLGFPNTGKSSIIKELTNAKVEVANYPFTTTLPKPAMLPYEDIKIQLVDTPPITEDGIPGPFMTTILNADLLLLLTDLSSDKCVDQLQILLKLL